MRNKFDEQLAELNVELIRMGALCEEGISAACKALLTGDMALAQKAKEKEKEIDQMERSIENMCMRLLLQQQPVARDLRTISSALKMISDMERIGDQAEDIAELTNFTSNANATQRLHIGDMARAAVSMVTDSVDSFVKKDLALARQVMEDDDKVDALFCQVKKELIDMVAADPSQGEVGLDLLMVAKYLERIGDHATNIAEWVEFSLTGAHPGA